MTREKIKESLRKLLAQQSNLTTPVATDVGEATAFAEVGLDSLTMLDVVYEVEAKFGIEINERELVIIRTIGHLLDLIEEKLATR
ncbi:MAG: acyl carrier protein [Myxococcota bacterium]|jgi:acyl carrier protein|nr:acyl carrier protein [Myxococcota bacterium]